MGGLAAAQLLVYQRQQQDIQNKKPKHHIVLVTDSLITANKEETAHLVAILDLMFMKFDIHTITCVGIKKGDTFLRPLLDDWLSFVQRNLNVHVCVDYQTSARKTLHVLVEWEASPIKLDMSPIAMILFNQPKDKHCGILPLETLDARIIHTDTTIPQLNKTTVGELVCKCL